MSTMIRRAVLLAELAGELGAGLVGWFLGIAGAVRRTVFDRLSDLPVSVRDFGAVGDGVADDTDSIQKAINYIVSKLGGEIEFPLGKYKVTKQININAPVWTPIIIKGAGNSVLNSTHDGIVFADASGGVRFENIEFSGPGKNNKNSCAISSALGQGWVKGCKFSGYYYGIECSATTAALIERNRFTLCHAGIRTEQNSPNFANMVNVLRNYFDFNIFGIYAREVYGLILDTNAFEYNSEAIYCDAVRLIDERGVNWYENNTSYNRHFVNGCTFTRGPNNRVVNCQDLIDYTTSKGVDDLNRQIALLSKSVPQAIQHNISTGLTWENEDSDPSNMHAANDSRVYINIPGVYRVTSNIEFAPIVAPGSGVISRVSLLKNGTAVRNVSNKVVENVPTQAGIVSLINCGSGDVLTLNAYQNSGAAISVNSGSISIEFVTTI